MQKLASFAISNASMVSNREQQITFQRSSGGGSHKVPASARQASPSPSYKRGAGLEKRISPVSKRKKVTSPSPKKFDKRRRGRSSTSSESDSESGSSSSTTSLESPQKRVRATDKALNERKLIKKPAEQATKKRSPISIEIKKPSTMVGVSALLSPIPSGETDNKRGHSPIKDKIKEKDKDKDKDTDKDGGGKHSRREELLKQLRAVEDAIAKKRSKLT
ncbi:Hypothetical predicted protein [Drosophila guanche]|uniref:Uncharacterized protein n=1 Tax=Drosophila guanche TaxID=7266 RepID=A0A3B0JE09_DROGU|nr:Hypothetical predicted protein [Drosophila guanche]